MNMRELVGTNAGTLVKLVAVLVGAFVAVELIEGLIGYAGIAMIQGAVVESLLAGTVPGLLLAGGIGLLIGAFGVLAVVWLLGRI